MSPFDRANQVDLELDGREITKLDAKRPRVDLDVIPTRVDGRIRGYDIEAKLKTEVGYDPSRLSMDPYRNGQRAMGGNRLHMFHLEVPKGLRSKGLGTILFNCYKEYAVQADFDFVSLRVGGGQDTKEFLVANDVNPEFLFLYNFPGADYYSVVLTTQRGFERVKDIVGIAQTAEQLEGVFVEDAFTDIR